MDCYKRNTLKFLGATTTPAPTSTTTLSTTTEPTTITTEPSTEPATTTTEPTTTITGYTVCYECKFYKHLLKVRNIREVDASTKLFFMFCYSF